MTLDDLRRADRAALEAAFGADTPVEPPRGRYRGFYLHSCASVGARRPLNRAMVMAGFRLVPFGLDFDASCWWFGFARARVGRFEPTIGRSRWRPANVLQLHYHPSRLPEAVRRHLYDEVKPLGPELCLGMGGLNRPAGEGELFYFALIPG
jgi:hypothetical protein